MKMWERYSQDSAFRALVEMMVAAIEGGKYTPTEVREAAMLAQIIFEERNPRPTVFIRADLESGNV